MPLAKLPYTTTGYWCNHSPPRTNHHHFRCYFHFHRTVYHKGNSIPVWWKQVLFTPELNYKVFPLATCSEKYSLHRMDFINQLFVSGTPLLAWATFDALFLLSARQIKSPASNSCSKSTPLLRNNKTITISNHSSQVGNKSSYSTRSLFMAPRKTIRLWTATARGGTSRSHTLTIVQARLTERVWCT